MNIYSPKNLNLTQTELELGTAQPQLVFIIFQSKQAEASLVKLQRKWPGIFTDLCFYSDVSNLLGVYNFRLGSRRFIQELFLEVQFSKVLI